MDNDRAYHRADHVAAVVTAAAALIIAVCFVVLVAWLVMAEQRTKLYEADNVVCASQPFAITCYERKAR
jgi:hypothetical protein